MMTNDNTKSADQRSIANRRATFFQQASVQGVANLELAFMTAIEEKLFDKEDQVDFQAMKRVHPELFTDHDEVSLNDMDPFVRRLGGQGGVRPDDRNAFIHRITGRGRSPT